MNAKSMTTRLLWKEYRLQRAFWLCMVLLAFMIFATVRIFMISTPLEMIGGLFGVAIVIPAFYALGCGATMFSAEHENSTFDFQRVMPVSPWRYFLANMLFGLISTLAMIALLLIIAIVIYTSPAWISRESLADMPKLLWPAFFRVGGVGVLELFAWGTFFSLILKRPLIAAILGVAVASIGVQLVITVPIMDASLAPYITAVPGRLAIVALVAAADVYLGCRWFRGEGILEKYLNRKRKIQPGKTPAVSMPVKAQKSRFHSLFFRLAWQQARQSAWIWIWYSVAIVGFFLFIFLKTIYHELDRNYFLGVIVGLGTFGSLLGLPLFGLIVFYPDQQRRMYRFFAERGAPPSRFWWSRQLAGMAIPLLLGLIFYLAFIVPGNFGGLYFCLPIWEYFKHQYEPRPWTAISLWAWLGQFAILFDILLIVYCVGQFCAMFLRSGILAMLFSLIISAALVFWTFLMMLWEVPWWWSIAPWPFLLLLATRLRASAWLTERRLARAWLRPTLVLLPVLAILIAVPCYRVFSVPLVDPGFSPEKFIASQKQTVEALKTVGLYLEANKAVVWNEKQEVESTPKEETPPEKIPEEQPWKPRAPQDAISSSFVKKNLKAIELALEAGKQPECDFYGDIIESSNHYSDAAWQATFLFNLVVSRAEQLTAEGELDAAWEHYLGALRIARHLNYHIPTWQITQATENNLYPRLVGWAARSGQTPERIKSAVKQFEQFPIDTKNVTDQLKMEYLTNHAVLSGNQKVIDRVWGINTGSKETKARYSDFMLWQRFLPWERYRALRMLNVITRQNLTDAHSWISVIISGVPSTSIETMVKHEPDYALKNQINVSLLSINSEVSYRLLTGFRYRIAHRNAALISMALMGWKHEHGAYPKTLEELVGSYFEKLPADPFCGHEFRYFPEGLSEDLKRGQGESDMWINGDRWYPISYYLPAKQPFLWSTGPKILDYGPRPGLNNDYSEATRYKILLIQYWSPSFEQTPTSESQIWRNGLIFPLP